jgi:hypothetical protein
VSCGIVSPIDETVVIPVRNSRSTCVDVEKCPDANVLKIRRYAMV